MPSSIVAPIRFPQTRKHNRFQLLTAPSAALSSGLLRQLARVWLVVYDEIDPPN
ncbi:MAG TPA: hypothetical protein VMP12_06735 [Candidatus Sulfotelmatobacter sp.]|nr:hypothetical protein [Candidatus Sulfotelmatobacter sp.]